MALVFDPTTGSFVKNGVTVPTLIKGSAQAAANAAQANINDLMQRYINGTITYNDWFDLMQNAIVESHAANVVLAHGGFNNVTAQGWLNAVDAAEKQLNYFASFAADVASGRYGFPPGKMALQRAGQYALSSRATYENERARVEAGATGATEAKRVLGALDHCEDCVAWADEWMPIDDLLENYPIGASRCHAYCGCVIVTR